ncbi:MAG TPA: sensor histidine kinase [Pyrinomonadaceae bacterium]|jgi:signal transduction histidine kinase|nr:sensor histidine kinase [Pyrinomonadaceae bacterium]
MAHALSKHAHASGLGPAHRLAVAAGVIVPCLVLAGWTFGVATLKNVLPGQPDMVPNTALAFLLTSASLWLLRSEAAARRARLFARACACGAALVGALTLAEYLSGLDLRIDTLLFGESLSTAGASFPGRPSPHTALCFLLVGSALLLLSSEGRRAHAFAQVLALGASLVSLLALVGYSYQVTILYGITTYTGMALHTALTFVLLSSAVLFARADRGPVLVLMSDSPGGHMARHLLPPAVLVPFGLGGLIVRGARAGLYDMAFGMSLCVTASIATLAVLIWRNARALHSVDAERRRAEGDLRRAHDDLEAKVAERTAELSRVNETLKAEAAEHRRVEAERVQLLKRLVTTQEEARRRLSRELHDQLGQYLSTMMLRVKTIQPLVASNEPVRADLQKLEELTGILVDEVHHLAWELRPAALDDLGLQTVLQNYAEKWAERSGVAVDFHGGGLERRRLPPDVETTVYRIVQESLTNVLKHAEARRVSVIVERRRDHVLVIVEDDGRGFAAGEVRSEPGRGLGLLGMRERVALVGGALSIDSSPGCGTTARARIPVPPAADKEVFPREYVANSVGR